MTETGMSIDSRLIGILAALGSALAWAVGSILFKHLGEKISPLAMTFAKGCVSVVFLGLSLVFTQFQDVEPSAVVLLILSGILGIALGDTFFFAALQDLSPHNLALLLMSGQVLTAILAIVFFAEIPSFWGWIGIFLVMGGIQIVLGTKLSLTGSKRRGMVFGFLSVLCMSISLLMAKTGLESISTIQATFIRMLAGTVGIFGFGLATGKIRRWLLPLQDFRSIGLFLLSVLVVTFGGFWLSLVAVKYVDVAVASSLNSLEPVFILPLGAVFLQEKITMSAVLGTMVALSGVVLLIFCG
jgi:drug/metabolite transporter (DMT)-like permease